jgi:mannose-6-phosphate isomerase
MTLRGPPLVWSEPRLVAPVWGGRVLASVYGKGREPEARLGESWEIWKDNRVRGSGRRLADVVDLPLLVKLLDTADVLSVQVHPDDAAAARLEGAPNGKAEAWVVLRAEPGARLAYGLNRSLTREELLDRAESGRIAGDLAWREVHAGDVIDVPPGTIHAIGAGLTLYELQQPADLTYRLYDHGRGRELHLAKAVEVAMRHPMMPQARARALGPGHTELLRNRIFAIERIEVPTVHRWSATAPAALTAIEGEVWIAGEPLAAGQSVVTLPGTFEVHGEGVVLVGRQA